MTRFFICNNRERKGFILTAALILAALIAKPWLAPINRLDVPQSDWERWEEAYAQMSGEEDEVEPIQPTVFDPNTATEDELTRLGLPASIARRMVRYREKGGRFQQAEDLGKIYGMRSSDLERLMPWVRIAKVDDEGDSSSPERQDPEVHFLPDHPFDPHTVSPEELRSWGLPGRVVNNWQKYLQAGGRFRQTEDLGKIYGMKAEWVELMTEWVKWESPAEPTVRESSFSKAEVMAREKPTIDINVADAETWTLLYGVGPVLSKRIVKFRDKLGGFYSVDQVSQTYGLPDSTFQRIRTQLVCAQDEPVQIPINSVGIDELASHPYISRRQAKALVAYRKQHGSFAQISDLQSCRVIAQQDITRLEPYLDFKAPTGSVAGN